MGIICRGVTISLIAGGVLASISCTPKTTGDQQTNVVAASTAAPTVTTDVAPAQHDVDDPLGTAGLSEFSDAAELVLVGRVTSVEERVPLTVGPQASVHPSDTSMLQEYSVVTINVEETFSGTPDASVIKLSQLTYLSGQPISPEGRLIAESGNRAVWFLNPIDPAFDQGGYIVAGQQGTLIEGRDGNVVVGDPLSPLGEEVAELGSFQALIEALRTT